MSRNDLPLDLSGSRRKEKIWKFLPRHKAKRGLRKSKGAGASRIPNRVSIHQRPKHIDKRTTFGHWEGDLMSFCKGLNLFWFSGKDRPCLPLSKQLPSKRPMTLQTQSLTCNQNTSKARKSLTLDNGGEFTRHQLWGKALDIKTFFCDPYASWQKGGVENTNGRLRRDLPRKTNIHTYNKEDFNETIDNYNLTPRKKLNWITPNEAFLKNVRGLHFKLECGTIQFHFC
ncbi:MAG: IS30 family transposase [Alphaproteobacteria bacterium]|nr:IS30 family transposase [Alphaproteobacteria bacterium]